MFHTTKIDIGKVRIGAVAVVEFPYEGIIIKKMVSPCDCNTLYDKRHGKQKRIQVKFQPKAVPEHLKQDYPLGYTFNKKIEIDFILEGQKDPEVYKENLFFTGEATI